MYLYIFNNHKIKQLSLKHKKKVENKENKSIKCKKNRQPAKKLIIVIKIIIIQRNMHILNTIKTFIHNALVRYFFYWKCFLNLQKINSE